MLPMRHKSNSLVKRPLNKISSQKQAGSAIVLAIFVILIISMLGAALVSLQRDNARGTSYEVYATRAYLNAYSASELALVTLFPLNSTSPDTTNCTGDEFAVTLDLTSDTGFHGCTANYQCQILSPISSASLPTRYKIISTAVCENAQTVTRRQIMVEASSH
jgi:MSHA biogenesis protein MshP